MTENLTFMMGEFEASFPTDRHYAQNHMWARVSSEINAGEEINVDDKNHSAGNSIVRFGFAAYAVRLLQDVYFLDWMLEAPAQLTVGQEIGNIESKKAESALYAPATGQLLQFNERLMDDPSSINVDKYGTGWLFEMEVAGPDFLTPSQYVKLLDDVWAKTQRTIKGQLNE